MFDIGFSELIVCAVVALIVIGPERMPEAVRSVGLWVGRFKRSLRETRSEIERQIGVDDIRRQLHNEEIMQSLENARRDMDNLINETQQTIDSTAEVIYKSEPDLPYHSHIEDVTEALAESPDTLLDHVMTPTAKAATEKPIHAAATPVAVPVPAPAAPAHLITDNKAAL